MAPHPSGYCPVFGNYPKEYNRAVHGPYYPHINYGAKDVEHFSQVKLGHFKEYFGKLNKTPAAFLAGFSRTYFNWCRNWMDTRRGPSSKAVFQALVLLSIVNMFPCYGLLKQHRNHKYHW